MKLTNLTPEGRFFGMFIGRSKSGKDYAAASFPKPMRYFDFDGRARGMLAAGTVVDDLDQVDVTYYPPRMGTDKLIDELNLIEMSIATNSCAYRTIYISSLMALARVAIGEAIQVTKGKMIHTQKIAGMEDYQYEYNRVWTIVDFLKSLPLNIILSAHIVNKFGKLDPSAQYSETGVVGEQLSIRDKLGENILTQFNEVYRFEREGEGHNMRFSVKFRTDMANTAYQELPDQQNVTNKNFYKWWLEQVQNEAEEKE